MVDASTVVARVTIQDPSNYLGVIYPGYTRGEVITIPRGQTKYITLYNGVDYGGEISFSLTFSGATHLFVSATLALSAYLAI